MGVARRVRKAELRAHRWPASCSRYMAMAFLPRTSLRCLLGGHEPLMRQKRNDMGRPVKPHVLIWECVRCYRELGETALGAKWNMLAKIRRQRTPAQIAGAVARSA
jgi:hypothetical protein